MKKLHMYILSVITITSCVCMELQLKQENIKPSLHTLMQNESYQKNIETLYEHSFAFIPCIEKLSYQNISENKNLIFLIQCMKEIQKDGIDEDHMSIHAYTKCNWIADSHEKQCLPLFFGCLKKYRLIINQTKEILPTSYDDTPSSLLTHQLFEKQYPTYINLITSLNHLSKLLTFKDFLVFLYSKKRMSFHHYPENTTIDLKNEFYPKVNFLLDMNMLEFDNSRDKLYELLQMIDKIKLSGIDEKKLGLAIGELDPVSLHICTTKEQVSYQKNRVIVFCSLVQHYNEKRKNKKTPGHQQYSHYFLIKYINLALPDSFDTTLIDQNIFAFEEFREFIRYIIQLKNSTKETIQQKVDAIYFSEKLNLTI